MIKVRDGNVLTSVLRSSKDFSELLNVEIKKGEQMVRRKGGKVPGPDDIHVEVWRRLGERSFYPGCLTQPWRERMPKE